MTGGIIPDDTDLFVGVTCNEFSCCTDYLFRPSPGNLYHMALKCFLVKKPKIILILIASFNFQYCPLAFLQPCLSPDCFKLHAYFITTKYLPVWVFHEREDLSID